MEIRTLFVAGAGKLGSGIAQVGIQSGLDVILRDVSDEIVRRAIDGIEGQLGNLVAKGRLSAEDKNRALARLKGTVSFGSAEAAQVAIEAVPEVLEIKKQVMADLDRVCPADTILASNTSSIPISKSAAATRRPEKVIGMHFMNPVPVVKMLEVIRGYLTSDDTFETIVNLGKRMGRDPIILSRDFGCFMGGEKDLRGLTGVWHNWLTFNDMLWKLVEGKMTPEEAATIQMATPGGAPMSCLSFYDFIGLDIALGCLETVWAEYGRPELYPHPLLRRLVEANHLGRKTGIGFFDYSSQPPQISPFLKRFLAFGS